MASFRRSGAFGLVGVVVVAVLVAAIALTLGSGEAKPRLALGLIFAVIAVFMALLLLLQGGDVTRAEQASARVPQAPPEVDDPTSIPEPELWAALAVGPIGEDALRARQEVWGTVRGSIRVGGLVTLLIFASVVPVYLLDTFVSMMIGVPLIAIAALCQLFRVLGEGGQLAAGYESLTRAMTPLGLRVVERPDIRLRIRLDRPLYSPVFKGALALEGERHGREVEVRFPAGGARSPSAVTLSGTFPDLEVRYRDGRLRAGPGAPDGLGRALGSLPASKRWRGVEVAAGGEGLVVQRKSSGEGDWLCDLWLAERIASVAGSRSSAATA